MCDILTSCAVDDDDALLHPAYAVPVDNVVVLRRGRREQRNDVRVLEHLVNADVLGVGKL